MSTALTPSQHAILAHAIHNGGGKLDWFPENLKGGARQKVIDALHKRVLITHKDGDWLVTPAAYAALGLLQPALAAQPETTTRKSRTRDNSKQAQVIAMLKRPEGATIAQIVEITGWQAHTVRGTFAGAFKKKRGLTITSTKEDGGERVYAIAG